MNPYRRIFHPSEPVRYRILSRYRYSYAVWRAEDYSLTVQTLTRFQEFSSKRSPMPMPSAVMRESAMP